MRPITNSKGCFTLHNGVKMPYLGLGVYKSDNDGEVIDAVHWAIEAGYRHIDTASIYGNEEGVGEGIRRSSIPREEIFVVSKVWNSDQGYDSTLVAFEESLKRLKLNYLDLYLIHWPGKDKFVETWKALEFLYKAGRIKAIGVSNFLKHHLETLLQEAEIVPMVNQMEFHPRLVQQNLIDYCMTNKIQYEAWSPLMRGGIFDIELLKDLSEKYGKSIPQIVLRWDLQKGVITIPKSSNKGRINANADLFDFELSQEDMTRIDQLDRNHRIAEHPDEIIF